MILYIIISILYCATFIAWLKTKQPSRDKGNYSNEYWYDHETWDGKYIALVVIGTVLWPLIIPFIVFYRIAFKILNKTKK
jgi:hypothetical protein